MDRGRTTLLFPERKAEPSGASYGVQLESQIHWMHYYLHFLYPFCDTAGILVSKAKAMIRQQLL